MTPSQPSLSYGTSRVWLRVSVGLMALGVLELAVGHLIVARVLGPPWSQIVDTFLVAATIILTVVVVTPVWAKPSLTANELLLDFGSLGGGRIPLRSISAVDEYRPPAFKPVPPGMVIDGDPPIATVSLGAAAGYVRLTLSEPIRMRHSLYKRDSAALIIVRLEEPQAAVGSIRQAVRAARTPE